jgi:hypothetical protein
MKNGEWKIENFLTFFAFLHQNVLKFVLPIAPSFPQDILAISGLHICQKHQILY